MANSLVPKKWKKVNEFFLNVILSVFSKKKLAQKIGKISQLKWIWQS